MNLVANAVDAIEGTGHITVSTRLGVRVLVVTCQRNDVDHRQ